MTPPPPAQAGFPLEEHLVTTQDGCILRMQRIPRKGEPRGCIACWLACWLTAGRRLLADCWSTAHLHHCLR